MKYSIKLLIKHTVETGEEFIEESIIMLDAESFDDAYEKAEQYVNENDICFSYSNIYGKRVKSEVVSYADCYLVFEDENAVEVYSSIKKAREEYSEETIIAVMEDNCSRKEMLPLRQWRDPDEEE